MRKSLSTRWRVRSALSAPPKPNTANFRAAMGGNAVTVPDDVKLRVHVANASPTHAFLLLPHVQLTLGRSPIYSFFLDLLAFKTSGRTS